MKIQGISITKGDKKGSYMNKKEKILVHTIISMLLNIFWLYACNIVLTKHILIPEIGDYTPYIITLGVITAIISGMIHRMFFAVKEYQRRQGMYITLITGFINFMLMNIDTMQNGGIYASQRQLYGMVMFFTLIVGFSFYHVLKKIKMNKITDSIVYSIVYTIVALMFYTIILFTAAKFFAYEYIDVALMPLIALVLMYVFAYILKRTGREHKIYICKYLDIAVVMWHLPSYFWETDKDMGMAWSNDPSDFFITLLIYGSVFFLIDVVYLIAKDKAERKKITEVNVGVVVGQKNKSDIMDNTESAVENVTEEKVISEERAEEVTSRLHFIAKLVINFALLTSGAKAVEQIYYDVPDENSVIAVVSVIFTGMIITGLILFCTGLMNVYSSDKTSINDLFKEAVISQIMYFVLTYFIF